MCKISIIIVNYKVADLVEQCIASIYEHTKGVEFEVFMVDNASGDGVVERISSKFPEVTIIANNQNLGFATACNQGIEMAHGEYILLLNPDTELRDDAISKIVSKMDQDQQIGIAGVHLLNPDGSHQSSGVRRFPRPLDQLLLMLKVPHMGPIGRIGLMRPINRYLMSDFDYTHDADVDQVMGAFFCIRHEVIKKIGFLDRGYFLWFEEVDFCKRAKNAGWCIRYFHDIEVIHHRGTSFKLVETFIKQTWMRRSLRRYMRKHHGRLVWLIFLILDPVFILLAAIAQIIKPK